MMQPNKEITVEELLKLIPDELLEHLAVETKVDYQVKKLNGLNMFKLLMYGLLKSDRIALRALQDVYNEKRYKPIFKGTIRFNSISARLATMNVDFFRLAYEHVYEECRQLYDEHFLNKQYSITRVDSTMVAEACVALENGMHVGRKKNGKKQVKYTVSLTDMFPSSMEIFTGQQYINENLTIPSVISKLVDKRQDNVFVFDRGVSSRDAFQNLDKNNFLFVTRLKDGTKYQVLEENTDIPVKVNNLKVLSDQKVFLFKTNAKLVEHPFRMIRALNSKGKEYKFLTNLFELPCEQILEIYKRRWDIEVFFRFLKQELNLKHFLSANKNGLQIMLYMTMIVAMLILIYKKVNDIGYRRAKYRFVSELEYQIIMDVTEKAKEIDRKMIPASNVFR